jgi:hypothetical protein
MQGSYLLFNKIIAATVAAIIIYFGIYPLFGDYAIKCQVLQATGHPCIGCGLTRGIHEALLFHFDKAQQWNDSSLLLLSFLVITVFLRFTTGILITKVSLQKHIRIILFADLAISLLLFLYCFRHFFTTQILK